MKGHWCLLLHRCHMTCWTFPIFSLLIFCPIIYLYCSLFLNCSGSRERPLFINSPVVLFALLSTKSGRKEYQLKVEEREIQHGYQYAISWHINIRLDLIQFFSCQFWNQMLKARTLREFEQMHKGLQIPVLLSDFILLFRKWIIVLQLYTFWELWSCM